MCGICGAISPHSWRDKKHAEAITIQMSDAISHRGPDGAGNYVDWPAGVALGHRRLAIIDALHGQQPIVHKPSGVTLVFNGEIYNYKALRSELVSVGYDFTTESDTEVLLLSYVHWGDACFEKFLGMFACALWDPRNQTLICARDRLGIKPFYFYYDENNFIFASEIKSIHCHPAYKKEINTEGVFDYSRYGYIPGEHTVYNDIYKLTAGSILTVKLGRDKNIQLNKQLYWQLGSEMPDQNSSSVTLNEAAQIRDELHALLADAVSSHMVSDVDVGVGALLSGGVDSTLVVDLMARNNSDISAHNVQFGQVAFDESKHASQVASLLGIQYSQENVPSDMCDDIEHIICHFDEPFADASAVAMYYLSQSASKRYKVCLSGDGGDELFAGYNWYAELLKFKAADDRLPHQGRSLVASIGRKTLSHSRRGSLFFSNLDRSFAERHDALVSVFQCGWAKSLLSDDALSLLKDTVTGKAYPPNRIRDLYNASPFGEDEIKNAQYADLTSYLIDDVLVKVDRMSMAHGLEVRVPLLDHRVVEFAFSIPTSMKIDGNQRKILLKQLLKDKYGTMFVNRPKQGFSVPLYEWLTTDLFHLVDHYLLANGKTTRSGYFKTDEVTKLWWECKHRRGRVDLSNNIWLLVCFEVWHNNLGV